MEDMDDMEEEQQEWERNPLDIQYACCSYTKGYVDQIVYICLTCMGQQKGGVCEQCAEFCHKKKGHTVYNIGKKSNFKCDCGNESKYPTNPCLLNPEKEKSNPHNIYNHNFENKWCYCGDAESNLMYQCIICEDWFHGTCLGVNEEDAWTDNMDY